jgi:hypothetical protein
MQVRTIPVLAVLSWSLVAVCAAQNSQNTDTNLESAFRQIDRLALGKPGDLPSFLWSKLTTAPPVGEAGTLVGRSFKDVGDKMTYPLTRAIIFESVYPDQEAVLEIVRQALLNSPSRLHPQIAASAIESTLDPEQTVIIEVAGAILKPEKGRESDQKAGGKFKVNLNVSDQGADPPSEQGPLTYRPVGTSEPGAMALGDAILAVAISVDPNLNLAQFPIALNGYALPEFNPPGFAANGPYNLRDPVEMRVIDPLLPFVSPTPTPAPLPSPTPVSP